uniref:Essential protein Yae1 N-terminal domain-containing protein n=1 Tax=Callorhinchus milii TaxID=7868 RepID=V9L9S5_CALMI
MWWGSGAGAEDVFDEEADELRIEQREWKSRMDRRHKEGYRDGLNAGRESTLQDGFNQGYQEGAKKMLAVGQLKGILSAVLSWCQLNRSDPHLITQINQLLSAAAQQEESIFGKLSAAPPEASVGDIMESIEEMGLDPVLEKPEAGCCGNVKGENCCNSSYEVRTCGLDNTASSSQEVCCRTVSDPSGGAKSLKGLCQDCAILLENCGLPMDIAHHFQLQS